MATPAHAFHELFEQLGLPADARSIAQFLATQGPLPGNVALADAPFWSPAQADFLRESLQQDNDWTQTVDRLNAALRAP